MLKLQEFHSIIIFELLPNRPTAVKIPDDNNASEIIRYFFDVQKRAKCLGLFRAMRRYQNRYLSYVHIATGKGGYLISRTENTVIIFHLVSMVKNNDTIYHGLSINMTILHMLNERK